ncbi:MAG: Ig-like domain-containing protein [Firmicutes bacterium]|nr:Ig-like domain-containing protein [Bacillota bacterium]
MKYSIPPKPATKVTVKPSSVEMMKGQTAELTAVLEPADSTDQVTWESNNDKVATVSKSGKVTAVKEGSARIIARANDDVYGYADITVSGVSTTDINLSEKEISIEEGGSRQLTATLTPADSTDEAVWASQDEDIATVSDSGLVIGQKEGTTVITVSAGAVTAKCEVKVEAREKGEKPAVIFRHADGRITEVVDGEIVLSCLDAGTFEYAGYDGYVYWKGSGSADPSGKFLPANREAKITIEAIVGEWDDFLDQIGDKYPEEKLTSLTLKVEKMNLTELLLYKDGKPVDTSEPLYANGTEPFDVSIKGRTEDGSLVDVPNGNFKYDAQNSNNSSNVGFRANDDNPYLMTVYPTGNGTDTFTAALKEDSSLKVEFTVSGEKVTVERIEVKVPSVFEIESWDMLYGGWNGIPVSGSNSLSVNVYPNNASVKSVKWTSENPEVAYYKPTYNSGIVPVKPGIAKFTVTSVDNPAVSTEVTIEFKYAKPLESASIEKDHYDLKAGDSILLNITSALWTLQSRLLTGHTARMV